MFANQRLGVVSLQNENKDYNEKYFNDNDNEKNDNDEESIFIYGLCHNGNMDAGQLCIDGGEGCKEGGDCKKGDSSSGWMPVQD